MRLTATINCFKFLGEDHSYSIIVRNACSNFTTFSMRFMIARELFSPLNGKKCIGKRLLFSLKQTHSVTFNSRDCWFTGECHSVILVSFVKSLKNESIIAIMIPWQRQITDIFDVVERVAVMYSLAIGGLGEISIQSLRMLFSIYIWIQLYLLSKVPTLRFL